MFFVLKHLFTKVTWRHYAYYLSTIPLAIFRLARLLTFERDDPHSAVLSVMKYKYKMSLAVPIDINRFKKVAKKQSVK